MNLSDFNPNRWLLLCPFSTSVICHTEFELLPVLVYKLMVPSASPALYGSSYGLLSAKMVGLSGSGNSAALEFDGLL